MNELNKKHILRKINSHFLTSFLTLFVDNKAELFVT